MASRKKKFWRARLALSLLQIPLFGLLMVYGSEKAMLIYLGWISVVTWIASELSAPEESE